MTIAPDDKDWTWVLERPCPECGFDTASFPRQTVGDLVRDNAASWQTVLTDPDVARRPAEATWSALEYACHVRDVFRLYDERLRLMLTEDDPHYANWDQDVTAVEERYSEQDPDRVAAELDAAAHAVAERFDDVNGGDWSRTGNRSDGAKFTVETFARYFVHDPIHHLHDASEGLARLGSA